VYVYRNEIKDSFVSIKNIVSNVSPAVKNILKESSSIYIIFYIKISYAEITL